MRLHCGRVDQDLLGRSAGAGESMKEIAPHALGRPADIPVVERLARPIVRRRVDPATARLQNMNDAADHAPVVDPFLAARVGRQMRFNAAKLLFREPKLVPFIFVSLSEAVNHNAWFMPSVLWVPDLRASFGSLRRPLLIVLHSEGFASKKRRPVNNSLPAQSRFLTVSDRRV